MGGAKRYLSTAICEWVMGFANGSTHPTYYSHTIVPGSLLVMTYTTLLTPFTSLMMLVATTAVRRRPHAI